MAATSSRSATAQGKTSSSVALRAIARPNDSFPWSGAWPENVQTSRSPIKQRLNRALQTDVHSVIIKQIFIVKSKLRSVK